MLQEQLVQASMKISELESELKRLQKSNTTNGTTIKEEIAEGHQKTELLRAKQDMMNRIIQMGEKSREAERNAKRLQMDESAVVNDFRMAISKLRSSEQLELIKSALLALDTENEKLIASKHEEKSAVEEKLKKLNSDGFEAVPLISGYEENSNNYQKEDGSHLKEEFNRKESELNKKFEELQKENKILTTNIEELDQQHSESIEKVLALKEELQKKHQCLQKAYEQLYVDFNEVSNQCEVLKSKIFKEKDNIYTENSSKNSLALQTEPIAVQENSVQANISEDVFSEITQKVMSILKNISVNVEKEETIFEAVAKQYVDIKWKKDVLERKVTEVTRELKQTSDTKESLQMECDDMQANIESLLVEIQHLKSNLPAIPEASEERVASLETETESLQEELKKYEEEIKILKKKNSELVAVKQDIEGTLRSQESFEAEVENTKEQLEFGTRKDEEAENSTEKFSRRLHATLEENDELRKRIDMLENDQRQTQEQLTMSLEKCKGLDENIELIEELKLDLDNVKRELKTSNTHGKLLESNLSNLQATKDEMERDNKVLSREIERLEADLSILKEAQEKGGDNDLSDLREQLYKVKSDKDDLEYDILNMRKELDQVMSQLEIKQNEVENLQPDNERLQLEVNQLQMEIDKLQKENETFVEQLTAIQDESTEKVELLNTEKTLLEQEHVALKQESENDKTDLIQVKNKLTTAEEKIMELENSLLILKAVHERRQSETIGIQNEIELQMKSKLEEDLKLLTSAKEQLSKDLEDKLTELLSKEEELSVIRDHCSKLESELRSSGERSESTEAKLKENNVLLNENSKLKAELAEVQQNLKSSIESSKESAAMARETIESLSQLIREKDSEIENLKTKSSSTNTEIENELSSIRKERDELVNLVQVKHNESLQYHNEIQRLTQLLNEQVANIHKLIAERDVNLEAIREKESEILWAQNELHVIRQRLKDFEDSSSGEKCGIVEHSAQIAQAAILNEKCKALEAALIQEQSNNRILQNQLTDSQNKEISAGKDLERLRSHLVEIEASYTQEALQAEEIRRDLEARLVQAEEKAKNSSTVYTSASIRANQQVETMQQQMALIVQQRDDIQNKLSAAEDKILSSTASLSNLQFVLEQFQRDKDKDIHAATEKIRHQLNDSYRKQEELSNEILSLKEQLAEAKECLQAASRLSEQLDKKSEKIQDLNQQVAQLTVLVNTADQRIQEANKSGEGKVDKTLVKNLFLGYLTSPTNDKPSVLRVISTVLDFNELEREKTGVNGSAFKNSWFSNLLHSGGHPPGKDEEASLSAAFVKFLESESAPKPQLPALPLSNTPLTKPGHSRQHSSSSTQSTLLLSNVTLPTFPDFVPARNTGSILKEVLKDS
ncbi:thyroid receptor-interacting protein 11-like isoform X2 [Belonocnema kinseyi]|nr:thyroid receptor-interacting protein 11-like isoform X2 [Belonocnema kinseyi]